MVAGRAEHEYTGKGRGSPRRDLRIEIEAHRAGRGERKRGIKGVRLVEFVLSTFTSVFGARGAGSS